MYKCIECGNIFDAGEEKHWTEQSGEEWTGCPFCGGSYEATVRCNDCEGEFFADELHHGFCEECIDHSLESAETFRKYLLDTEQLSTYMFWCCGRKEPKHILEELEVMLLVSYDLENSVRKEKCYADRHAFVFRSGEYSLENYADWLSEQGNT